MRNASGGAMSGVKNILTSVRVRVRAGQEVPAVVRTRGNVSGIVKNIPTTKSAGVIMTNGVSRIPMNVKGRRGNRVSAGGWTAPSFANRIPMMNIVSVKVRSGVKSIRRIAKARPEVRRVLPGVVAHLPARQVPVAAVARKNAAIIVQNTKMTPPAKVRRSNPLLFP